MAGEANKELVTRFVDTFWSNGDLTAIGETMAPDAIIHSPPVGDSEGLKAFNRTLRAAFPDWYSTAEELVAEGAVVVER